VAAHGRGRQRSAGAAEQLPAARAERPTIEVVDTQGGDPPTDLLSHICRQRPPAATAGLHRQGLIDRRNLLTSCSTFINFTVAEARIIAATSACGRERQKPGTISCVN
jgi:hypothetical protein